VFNLQGSEIIIVMLLALVVLGPEKLPDAMRKMGQMFAELKKLSSGFQNEFRSAIDEPMRELRDTANVLRDSADFTKLQEGERQEKPKSAEMAPVNPDDVPTDAIPTFESPNDDQTGPDLAADSQPAPFADDHSDAERPAPTPTPVPAPPLPFSAMSAPEPSDPDADDATTTENVTIDNAASGGDEPAVESPPSDGVMPSGDEGTTSDVGDDAGNDTDDETNIGR
jgi:sec-independent protein translocase protein TatB